MATTDPTGSLSRVAVVTGGSSGLGAAVVTALSKAEWTPWVLDILPPGEGVGHVLVDLADGRAAEAAARSVIEQAGRCDAVVTAAGVDACGTLEEVAPDAWDRVVAVNLIGTAAVVRAALPALRASRGTVVTVASTLGLRALSHATAYCASKFGVVGFTRALAREMGGAVGVTLLVPGGMDTHFFDGRDDQFKPGPGTQLNRPEDVAAGVLFALDQPPGCEVRELVLTPSTEPSWP